MTKSEQFKANKTFNKMMSKINKSADLSELKKEGDLAYASIQKREDNLVLAFENKKLKSKALIKEVKKIIEGRNKKLKQQEKKKERSNVDVKN